MPEISVIVVNWNRKEYLRGCLDSLAIQEDADFEVIVVDNGSTDGSAQMVRDEYVGRFAVPLRLIRNRENRGFCAANNQGIQAAEGRFIALLNNDAEAEPRFLAELRKAFELGADVGMAAAKVVSYEDPRRIDKAGHLIFPDGQNRGRGTGEVDRGQYERVEECLWPDGCAAMYRKSMLEQIGGFDEDFFMYGDDAELGLRARLAGWRCYYMPGAVVRHRRAGSLGKGSLERIYWIERNRVLLALKLFPVGLLLLNPYYYGLRLAAGLAGAVRDQGEVAQFPGIRGKMGLAWTLLRADLAALRLAPLMWRKRKALRPLIKLDRSQIRELLNRHRAPLGSLAG